MLDIEKVDSIRRNISELLNQLDNIIVELQREKLRISEELTKKLEELKFYKIDLDKLMTFLDEPYCLIPRRKDEWYVVVPKWIPFQLGWLWEETPSYYIFIVNKYIQ